MATTYLITESYDGSHVRIIASSKTKEGAERQYEREARARRKRGYMFFSPVRRIVGDRRQVENELDRRLVALATW